MSVLKPADQGLARDVVPEAHWPGESRCAQNHRLHGVDAIAAVLLRLFWIGDPCLSSPRVTKK